MNFSAVRFMHVVPVGVDTHRESFLHSEGWTLREVGSNWVGISRTDKPEAGETLVPVLAVKKAVALVEETKKK